MDFGDAVQEFGRRLAELGAAEPVTIEVGRHDFGLVRDAFAGLTACSVSASNALFVEGQVRMQAAHGEIVIRERR